MLLKETQGALGWFSWALADVPLDRLREVKRYVYVHVCVQARAWTKRKSQLTKHKLTLAASPI